MIPNSTRLRHPLLLVLVPLLSATSAVTLVPAANAAIGGRQTLTASTTTTTWPTLRYAARGSAVVYLQQRLTALRYDVGGVDGGGPTTSTAATRCTSPIRCRPTRPAMAVSA